VTSDLQLAHVGKVYDNGTPAVIDFNLEVSKGEFIAFLGPSGCGKTTTLRMIAGFESITSGDIFIRGNRINNVPPERRPTAMIFQNYALFPHMTVRGNIRFGLDMKKMPAAERDDKVERILDKLGLTEIGDFKPDRLSGGQKQRIALARALVVEPDILLLDEPLGALDANLRKSIQNELKLLQRRLGITFVFVTHAQSEALALSDRIVVMNAGRIEQVSAPYELYTRPQTLFVARFIGRNALIAGKVKSADEKGYRLETAFGELSGVSGGVMPDVVTNASIAVPAEAIDVLPISTSPDYVAATYGGNPVMGTIESIEQVGHIVQLVIVIGAAAEPIVVEAHADKYAGRFHARDEVLLAWKKDAATLISH
jgi:putative spermidine/putrescine transport system ATP-binding protein/spermidine/putrescine transport system ATP-binding protein